MSVIEARSIGERIRLLRDWLDISGAELARDLGVSTGYIPLLERGKNAPSDLFLTAMALRYGVSLEWLKVGQGEPFQSPREIMNRLVPFYRSDDLRSALDEIASDRPAGNRTPTIFDRSDGELKQMQNHLADLWRTDDHNMKGWIVVQFRNAFPTFAGEAQKKSAPSGAGTTNGAQIS